MNKKIFWTTLILITLTLTACASIARTTGTAPSGSSSAGELLAQTKLILGVINLEETENTVTVEQAKELISMFYVLQDLNDSDTAAQEEKDGLVNQIQETLTTEQAQAIDAMSLTRRDMFAVTQGNSAGSGSSNAASTSGAGGGGGMGGPPYMGGMPGGGPDEMPGGNFSAPTTKTTSASSDASAIRVMDTSTPSALFDAVIELLEKKVQ